jgi:hypothetical protein
VLKDGQVDWATVTAPHCDQTVLHAPGECEFCDACPEWQEYRMIAHIAFTGHEPGEHQVACPSDQMRGRGEAHVWGGNRPTNVDVPQQETHESLVMYRSPAALADRQRWSWDRVSRLFSNGRR